MEAYALIAVVLIGSLIANGLLWRKVGHERAKNRILERGLEEAKRQRDKQSAPVPTAADEQRRRL